MKQIYQLQERNELKYVLDPHAGPVKKSQAVIKATDTHAISHEGEQYQREDDLTFLLPDHVADHYLRMPGWHEGVNPFYEGDLVEAEHKAQEAADREARRQQEEKAEQERQAQEKAEQEAAEKREAAKIDAEKTGK